MKERMDILIAQLEVLVAKGSVDIKGRTLNTHQDLLLLEMIANNLITVENNTLYVTPHGYVVARNNNLIEA